VPAVGLNPQDMNFPWHFSLMPISPSLLAVERSILECAYAGCNTIWVVCNDDMQLLLRHRMKDWVFDPRYMHHHKIRQVKDPEEYKKRVPIYYVPIHPNDRDRRDSYGWSVIAGAYAASRACRKFSERLVPPKFYASFPTGIYPHWFLRDSRTKIRGSKKPFYVQFEGKTVSDDLPLGFSFTQEMLKIWKENIRIKGTIRHKVMAKSLEEGVISDMQILPIPERNSASSWTLGEVFSHELAETSQFLTLGSFFDISTWSGYAAALATTQEYMLPYGVAEEDREEFPPACLDEGEDELRERDQTYVLEGWLKEKWDSPNRK